MVFICDNRGIYRIRINNMIVLNLFMSEKFLYI